MNETWMSVYYKQWVFNRTKTQDILFSCMLAFFLRLLLERCTVNDEYYLAKTIQNFLSVYLYAPATFFITNTENHPKKIGQ